MRGWFNIGKSVNFISPFNKIKEKIHMITSTDTKKAFDEIQHPFIINILNKQENPQTDKGYVQKAYS